MPPSGEQSASRQPAQRLIACHARWPRLTFLSSALTLSHSHELDLRKTKILLQQGERDLKIQFGPGASTLQSATAEGSRLIGRRTRS